MSHIAYFWSKYNSSIDLIHSRFWSLGNLGWFDVCFKRGNVCHWPWIHAWIWKSGCIEKSSNVSRVQGKHWKSSKYKSLDWKEASHSLLRTFFVHFNYNIILVNNKGKAALEDLFVGNYRSFDIFGYNHNDALENIL